MTSPALPRVVVTGLGALTPLGHSVPDTWNAMLAGESGAATITHFDPSAYTTTFACEVKNFDPRTVKRLHHVTEFVDGTERVLPRAIRLMRGKE